MARRSLTHSPACGGGQNFCNVSSEKRRSKSSAQSNLIAVIELDMSRFFRSQAGRWETSWCILTLPFGHLPNKFCFISQSICFISPSNLLHFPKKMLHFPNSLLHFPNKMLHFPNRLVYFPMQCCVTLPIY